MSASVGPSRAAAWGSFVKIEHTLFSLPVLFAGALLGARGLPSVRLLIVVTLAGVGARTLAMALNRIIDRRIDAENPRTAERELPGGRLGLGEAWTIAAIGSVLYVGAVWQLPPICRWLAPVPVAVFALYPYMKRFTSFAHFGVGCALALAPLGAFLAVVGGFRGAEAAIWLALFTLLWVAGFDIIYATMDIEFDRRFGLHSLPARLGREPALRVSAAVHAVAVGCLAVLYWRHLSGVAAPVAGLLVAILLVAESRLAARVDLAFFRINIVVGFVVLAMVGLGIAGV